MADLNRFNRAQGPLLEAALRLGADHVDRLRAEGFSTGEAIAVAATALLSSAVTLMVAFGYSKEKAVFAMQTALAAPFAHQPPPASEGTPN
jgi:hypothetical protein